jgi:hypothetical protein
MSKNWLLLMLILLLSACGPRSTPASPTPAVPELDVEEQAVYAALLKSVYSSTRLVIMESTYTGPAGVDDTASTIDYVLKNLHDVDASTAANFKTRNASATPISPGMDLGIPYYLLTQDQRAEMFGPNQNGWDLFYKNYPAAPGITELSLVGFNTAFDQALVYLGQQSNYLAGSGAYYLLVKADGVWTVSQTVMTWIS